MIVPPFGYTPRTPDDPHRGIAYRLTPAYKSALDRYGKIDLFPNVQPPTFQYRVGSCTGQGFAHAAHYVMLQAEAEGILGFPAYKPSPMAIYAAERDIGHSFSFDGGSTLANGVKVLTQMGIPREEDWPYDETQTFVHPPGKVWENASAHVVTNAHPLVHHIDDYRHALATDCPIAIGVPCYEGTNGIMSNEAFRTGEVGDPSPSDDIKGWHCLVIYSHDPATRRFGFMNWWPQWGLAGRGTFTEDFVLSRSNEAYAIGAIR